MDLATTGSAGERLCRADPVFRQRPGRSAVSSWPGSPAEARAGGREQGAATCIAAGGWAAQEALNAFRLDGMADG
jgi:hypothetical protein